MHEMRATPYPLDKAVVNDRAVSFQWPLRSDMNSQDSPLDGFEHKVKKVDKTKVTYRLRYSQDAGLKSGVTEVKTRWPFYNPEKPLAAGVWYWQKIQDIPMNRTELQGSFFVPMRLGRGLCVS